jgi:hypothetical protein
LREDDIVEMESSALLWCFGGVWKIDDDHRMIVMFVDFREGCLHKKCFPLLIVECIFVISGNPFEKIDGKALRLPFSS